VYKFIFVTGGHGIKAFYQRSSNTKGKVRINVKTNTFYNAT